MKKFTFILAAMMLLCAQNVGAWGFQASYYGGADNVNWNDRTFYINGYSSTSNLQVYMLTTNTTMTWFSVTDDGGGGYGFSGFSYGSGAIVRATAFWNGTSTESKYTAILPDGKVFIIPAGGTRVEMDKNGYIYTAIVSGTSVTIEGASTGFVTTALYGGASAANGPQAPYYTQLGVPNVPVPSSITTDFFKVIYNLETNQVTFENVPYQFKAVNPDLTTDFPNNAITFYTDGNSATTSLFEFVTTFTGAKDGFNIWVKGSGMNGVNAWVTNFSPALANGTVVRATAKLGTSGEILSNYTTVLPDGKVFANNTEMTNTGNDVYTAVIQNSGNVVINGSPVTAVWNNYGISGPVSLQLNVPSVPVTTTSNMIKVTYNLRTNKVTTEPLITITYSRADFNFSNLTVTVKTADPSYVTEPFLYIEDSETHSPNKTWATCEANRTGYTRTQTAPDTYTFVFTTTAANYAYFFGIGYFERLTATGIDVFVGYGAGNKAQAFQGNKIPLNLTSDANYTGANAATYNHSNIARIYARPMSANRLLAPDRRDTINMAMPFVVCYATANPTQTGTILFRGVWDLGTPNQWDVNNALRPFTLVETRAFNGHIVYLYEYAIWNYATLPGATLTSAQVQAYANGSLRNLGVSVNGTGIENNESPTFVYKPETIILDRVVILDKSIALGNAETLTAKAFTNTNVQFPSSAITSYTWSILETTSNTIDPTSGLFTANETGVYHVQCVVNYNGQTATGTAVVTIAAEDLDHIVVTPSTATIEEGQSQQFTAQGKSATNTNLNTGIAYSWSITPASNNVISETGLFTAYQAGTYTVTCTAAQAVQGGEDIIVYQTASITVTPFNPAQNLAAHKPAFSRDYYVPDGAVAGRAVDLNTSTFWMAAADQAGAGSWLYVDLGGVYMLNKIAIFWHENRWPNGGWHLQVSTTAPDANGNTNDWTDVYTGAQATNNFTANTRFEFPFAEIKGRYVRFVGDANAVSMSYGYAMKEFEVYGTSVYNPYGNTDLSSVVVLPAATVTGYVGDPINFTASALDGSGAVFEGADITWSCDVVPTDIDEYTGVFTPTSTGLYTITATATDGSIIVTGTSAVNVNAARVPATVTITFDHNYTLYGSDEQAHFVVAVKDQFNNTMTDVAMNYQVSAGMVTPNGLEGTITLPKGGDITLTVTATKGTSLQQTANITFVPAPKLGKGTWSATTNNDVVASYGLNPMGAIDGVGTVNNDLYLWRIPQGGAEQAVNNDFPGGMVGGNATNEFLVINMHDIYSLDLIELLWEGANPRSYKVWASEDSINWTEIGGQTALPNQVWVYYRDLTETTDYFQYIKIGDIVAGTQYGVKLLEFTAWGRDIYPDILNINEGNHELVAAVKEKAGTYAKVFVDIRKGAYDIAKVTFTDIGNDLTFVFDSEYEPETEDPEESEDPQPAPMRAPSSEITKELPLDNIFVLDGLTPLTPYSFSIEIEDVKGNKDIYSNVLDPAYVVFSTTNGAVITDINQPTEQNLVIYPNPVYDILYINGLNDAKEAKIIDILGKVQLVSISNGTINVSNLTKGIYILIIDNQRVKFIKK